MRALAVPGAHGRRCSCCRSARDSLGTLLPAFGYLPAIGGTQFVARPVAHARSRIRASRPALALTLVTGVATTVLSVALACGLLRVARTTAPWTRRAGAWLAPMLATPHSALAIGLAFLIAPSGWIVRALSPWLTGWTLPPDVATVGDPSGCRAGRSACC